ncbi:hypothetical protein [Acanthopleuribacter pedis]|uniref:Uncharacterized protein n=1 Tax=Acanthopleuribacter pedis TaxID=442870 RepID=A0A8J7U6D4_9BACT|nr:hypothetical protein [Acanthopleuribacter pedis]MBO1321343.1 hypothetical protein [Acanthopleuribacter pedis]
MKKVFEVACIGAALVGAIWLSGLVLKVLTGLLGLIAAIAGSILHFLLSKSVLTLAVLGFIVYLVFTKKPEYERAHH